MSEDMVVDKLLEFMIDYIRELRSQNKILELKVEAYQLKSKPIDKKEYNKRFTNRKYLKPKPSHKGLLLNEIAFPKEQIQESLKRIKR